MQMETIPSAWQLFIIIGPRLFRFWLTGRVNHNNYGGDPFETLALNTRVCAYLHNLSEEPEGVLVHCCGLLVLGALYWLRPLFWWECVCCTRHRQRLRTAFPFHQMSPLVLKFVKTKLRGPIAVPFPMTYWHSPVGCSPTRLEKV